MRSPDPFEWVILLFVVVVLGTAVALTVWRLTS